MFDGGGSDPEMQQEEQEMDEERKKDEASEAELKAQDTAKNRQAQQAQLDNLRRGMGNYGSGSGTNETLG
mgnify:CR=1 FL=1